MKVQKEVVIVEKSVMWEKKKNNAYIVQDKWELKLVIYAY